MEINSNTMYDNAALSNNDQFDDTAGSNELQFETYDKSKLTNSNPNNSVNYNEIGFYIDWNYFMNVLSSKDVSNLAYDKDVNIYLPYLDVQSQMEKHNLTKKIQWNNPNYIGYCRPYFYTYIAFIHITYENSIKKHIAPILYHFFDKYKSFFDTKIKENDINYFNEKFLIFNYNNNVMNNFSDFIGLFKDSESSHNHLMHILTQSLQLTNNIPLWLYYSMDFYNTSNIYYNQVNNEINLKKIFDIRYSDEKLEAHSSK